MAIEALRQQEARFRALIEHSTEAIALLTAHGMITYASPSTRQVTGYTPADMEGRSGLSFVHLDDVPQMRDIFLSMREQPGASTSLVGRVRTREGAYRWMEGIVTNQLADPNIQGWIINYRDITAFQRLVQERDEARQETQAAQNIQQQTEAFISLVVHELRAPLTSIKGNIQLAQRRLTMASTGNLSSSEPLPGGIARIRLLLERAERQAGVQERLVSDLLDTACLHLHYLNVQRRTSDLVALIQQVVEDQRLVAPTRLITSEIPVATLLLPIDHDRIAQVLTNYISNALKYAPNLSPVVVRLVLQRTQVRVEVVDQGPGLSEEQQRRVWERFYRVSERSSLPGVGLGLPIARQIIALHQGETGVQSRLGAGATFWFTLPLPPSEPGRQQKTGTSHWKSLPPM